MEDLQKYLPVARKALLSTIAFLGYLLVKSFLCGFVEMLFQNEETRLFGYPQICYVIQTVFGCVIALFVFYDYYLCDRIKEKEFVERYENESAFSLITELKTLIKTPEFVVGQCVIIVFSFAHDNVTAIPTVLFSIIAELWAHRNWFSTKDHFGKKKKKKGFYAFHLLLHIGIWVFNFIGLSVIVLLLKTGFTPIVEALKNYVLIIVSAFIILSAAVFVLNRIRAIRVQYRLIRKLKRLSNENRMKLTLPKHPYISLLRQKCETFTLEHRKLTVKGVIIPTILRKTPLCFLGNGIVQRIHKCYFFKIELFNRNKFFRYSFPEIRQGEKRVILLSPIPRQFYLGNHDYSNDLKTLSVDSAYITSTARKYHLSFAESDMAEGDNGSTVDNALIYSGSAFCNYIERLINET